ncbi:MAG: hypothetical protein ACYCZX_20610 [Rhodospirillaceae bacterium]
MSAFQKLWRAIAGKKQPVPKPALPPVVIHDPAAQGPHDLDDPFFDGKVQARVADVIAHAGQKK